MELYLEGSKGGSEKAHTPVETPNNLLSVAYAKVLLAVAEGELAGTPTGKDIFLNGTPLLDDTGQPNFGGVTWEWRSGSVDQSYIQGMPEVSNETSVGVELRSTTPWVREISKESLSAVRVTLAWPALMTQKSNGDTIGVTIDYAIDLSVNGGAYQLYSNYQVSGKTNTDYERTHRVTLPTATSGWTIRIRRITANSESSLIQDTMNIKSFAEVVDAKQRYPNTALLFVQFDSRMFGGGSIPKISVKTKGRLVRVPNNYDPNIRTYTGVWDGTFKWAWTDNPAWIFFDIVTQNRFGLGNRVTLNQIDKWELYEVAQYCDVLVDDGTGSGAQEPRHTCNIYIQSQADAWTVLRDVCSIFNGMTYWDGNQFIARADKQEPLDNIPLFGRSNVIGDFDYQTTDERTIFTSALVSYDEPADHYGTQVEAVWEKSQILRWGGDRQTTLAAIGCTSRGEAQRKGKYTLLTNMFNRSVAFKTGLQGLDHKVRPGAIIGVADPLIAGKEFTGRLTAATLKVLTLDRETDAVAGDKMFITRKDGSQEARTIQAVAGKVITVTTDYSEIPKANSVWYLEAEDLKSQLFKIVKLVIKDGTCEINAVEYNDSKYAAVDNGARLEPRPISKVPPQAQQAPTPVVITAHTYTEQMMAITTMTISWPKTQNAVLYEGQWRVGSGDWVTLGTTGGTQFDVKGIYTGQYLARVRAINALGIKSAWTLSAATDLNGKAGSPPALTSLTVDPIVFGMRINWTFPDGAEDTARTEIMYGPTVDIGEATKLGDFAYPQYSHDMNGLKAGARFFFWGRLVDRTGNIGPWYPTGNGVMGFSSTDVAEYEEYFIGQINESALGQELFDKVESIGLLEIEVNRVDTNVNWIESQLGGIELQLKNDLEVVESELKSDLGELQVDIDNVDKTLAEAIALTNKDVDDIKEDVVALNTTLDNIQNQVDGIVDALEYNPNQTYLVGESTRVGNRLYQAKQNVPTSMSPPNATYWQDIGEVVTQVGALASQVSINTTDISTQGGTLTAQAGQLTALTTRVTAAEGNITGNSTAITNLTTTVTTQGNTITSQGSLITGLRTDVTNLQTGQSGNASAITSLTTRVTTAEGTITSQGQSITSLGASLGTLQTQVNGVQSTVSAQGTAITGLTTTVTQQGGTITSHGNSITALESSLAVTNTNVTGLQTTVTGQGTSITNLQNTVTTQGNTITAQGQDITTLEADVSIAKTDISGLKTTTTAQGTAISNLQTTSTSQGNAITVNSNSITDLTAEVHFNELDALYEGAETDAQIADAIVISRANASATESLTSVVTSQGGVITAQGQSITNLTAALEDADGNIVGQGTAIESLKTTVTTQGNNITSQGSSITSLNNSLTITNDNVAAAQTDATNALTQVATKADAAAVTALTTRVTSAEGTISSQGTSITSLNNSLTTTNTNVTTAQNAAQAASDLAGIKGEVIYGSTAPAVGKQLPQNLWIDTTSGGNTPKRWLTNAWVVVTDKVATDAAAAAASALSQVATKAEASAVTALTTRVTNAEGVNTTQGTSITTLNNSLTTTNTNVTTAQAAADAANTLAGGKGKVIVQTATPAVGDQLVQNLWIDITGGANTPKRWLTNAWVAVTDKVATDAAAAAASALAQVATKADASALTALTNTVTTQGTDISANAEDITLLNTEVHFKELDELYAGAESDALIADALKIASGAATANESLTSTVTQHGDLITAQAEKITDLTSELSDIDGEVVAQGSAIQNLSTITTTQGNSITSQSSSITSLNNSLVTTASNVTAAQNAANAANTLAGGKGKVLVQSTTPVAGDQLAQNLWIDITGGANTPKRWTGSAWAAVTDKVATDAASAAASALSQVSTKAEASAVSTLTTRVTDAEGLITAQATKLDGVYAQINPDLAGDSVELAGSTAMLVGVWTEQSARIEDGIVLGQRIETVEAVSGENTAIVQEVSQSMIDLEGNASAMWSVKLQVNSQGQYVAAGIGLGIENGPAGLQSSFLVSADTFAVVNGVNSVTSTPFVVSGGQVFIKDTIIQDASISNAKIGNYIQSNDFVENTSGWQLDKGGTLKFNGNNSGYRLKLNNQGLYLTDTNTGVVVVELGLLS